MPINKKKPKTASMKKTAKGAMKATKKSTDKIVLSSLFKTIIIDGKTEQVTRQIRRTLLFDHVEVFPFTQIKKIELVKNEKESITDSYLTYAVLLHLNNGKTMLVDELGETSVRGGFKEMKNLGKKIGIITGKEFILCDD
ncbi:hypothetical protein [Candidatus Kuenenia sp.]|uniref:hypothetical protein n=1 Tax=Candidatus Kuenenia sp. TaxID=2499824 RepID=UPI00321FD81B